MSLINLRSVTLNYGGPLLFDRINLAIENKEKICLVGRNGTGKSTLMKLINGDILPDSGQVERKKSLRIALLTQQVPNDLVGSVYEVVAAGLSGANRLLADYHLAANRYAQDGKPESRQELEKIQHALDSSGGWELERQVNTVLSRLELAGDSRFEDLSGGLKRRALLGAALVHEPELLLLDEPTNHLDIAAIQWLEEFLANYQSALLFISHDRSFSQKLATRIIELDRGQLYDWQCDYVTYIQRKEETLAAEAKQQALFDKKLAQEEAWLRQGIKARRTRNEGRVRALKKLRQDYQTRRKQLGSVRMPTPEVIRSGNVVIAADNISYHYEKKTIVSHFSTLIMRGDKVGIIGANGSGKTTLLQLLLGEIMPQQGQIQHGTRLEIAYFDQLRAQLNEDKTVQENVSPGTDTLTINGKNRHIVSYLQDFLFAAERIRTPVKALSGGERNRVLLAKLFTKPCNLLVMDEPTNDLDIETLEFLEELLLEYSGTLLLVSHDRTFLNNVVTSIISVEGNGEAKEYVGGYDDYLRQHKPDPSKNSHHTTVKKVSLPTPTKPRKLSYKEQRELEILPNLIEALEKEQQELHQAMVTSDFYKQDSQQITQVKTRLGQLENDLAAAYQRWNTLENLK